MAQPPYSTTYIYNTYSQHKVAKISRSNTQSLGHTSELTMGWWHWFIYSIPGPHSKLLQWVHDIDWTISIAYIAQLWVKYGNRAELGSDKVPLTDCSDKIALTGHSDKVALTACSDRLLWQVALTGCSDRLFWQAHPTLTSTSANFVWPTLATYSTLDPGTLVVTNPGGRTTQILY
jgi:hypothetical protein